MDPLEESIPESKFSFRAVSPVAHNDARDIVSRMAKQLRQIFPSIARIRQVRVDPDAPCARTFTYHVIGQKLRHRFQTRRDLIYCLTWIFQYEREKLRDGPFFSSCSWITCSTPCPLPSFSPAVALRPLLPYPFSSPLFLLFFLAGVRIYI